MRGYYEESDEVKTRRELHEAARKYAGLYLYGGFIASGEEVDRKVEAEKRLEAAALAFAKAKAPVKKRRAG